MASVPPDYAAVAACDDRKRIVSGNGLAVGSMLLWAAGFPAAEILLDSWHPLTLMMFRLSLALGVLVPLWVLIDGLPALLTARWRRGLWIGVVGFGTGTNLLLFAQWYTDPVTVALIATTTPIAATLIEVAARHRRISARFLLGLTASVIGGAIAIGGKPSADLGIGVLMAIGSGFFYVWASHAAVRDFPDLSPVGRTVVTFTGAALFTAVVFAAALWSDLVNLPAVIRPEQIGLLWIYAVASMALSHVLFIASVGRLGIALTSFHMNVAPFYVMVLLLVLGGTWDWRAALGAVVVGIGVVISQRDG